MYNPYQYRQGYRPVTAYTVTQPVVVQSVDISKGLYPVLNYKPTGALYPFIYVPIAEFQRVGASVTWDERLQVLSVTTDIYQLMRDNQGLQNDIDKLEREQ